MATKKQAAVPYLVLENLCLDDEQYRRGDTVTLEAERAAELVARGVLADPTPPEAPATDVALG